MWKGGRKTAARRRMWIKARCAEKGLWRDDGRGAWRDVKGAVCGDRCVEG